MTAQVEPAAYAVVSVVVADDEEEQVQWEVLRRRVAARPQYRGPCIADVCRAYEEATGTRVGCD